MTDTAQKLEFTPDEWANRHPELRSVQAVHCTKNGRHCGDCLRDDDRDVGDAHYTFVCRHSDGGGCGRYCAGCFGAGGTNLCNDCWCERQARCQCGACLADNPGPGCLLYEPELELRFQFENRWLAAPSPEFRFNEVDLEPIKNSSRAGCASNSAPADDHQKRETGNGAVGSPGASLDVPKSAQVDTGAAQRSGSGAESADHSAGNDAARHPNRMCCAGTSGSRDSRSDGRRGGSPGGDVHLNPAGNSAPAGPVDFLTGEKSNG